MSTTTTSLPTGTWNVDPSHSHVTFSVRHIGISKVRGEFGAYEGQLVIGEDGTLTASGSVKVDSISTKDENRDGHLKSADFFDVENYPEITFQSTGFTALDEDTYEITGDLTLHGVTKPITLTAELGGTGPDPFGGERVGLEVKGEISRGEFGMKFNMALGTGNAVVSDTVKLDFDIEAVKQA
jgi:polyisoprenoid-binding protein YceI